MEEKRYAIIDGAIEEGLLDFLGSVDAAHGCLYAEPIEADLVALAPRLVEVTEEVSEWLTGKSTPWGMYLESELPLRDLLQHFRHFLWVTIPEQDKPVLMRFYDPRNIWALTKVLSSQQLLSFIAPVKTLSTQYGEERREDNFAYTRADKTVPAPAAHLTLTHRQYNLLKKKAQDNYFDALARFILEIPCDSTLATSLEKESARTLAEEYFYFCDSLEITDEQAIELMATLLLEKNISDTQTLPEGWQTLLSNRESPGLARVQQLALPKLLTPPPETPVRERS